jgi:hypothetical protein
MSEQKSTWCIWSTAESVQNDVPSVTAILETIIAVPLYWWIALRVGMLLPLLISVAIAPLVLLRSEQSVLLAVPPAPGANMPPPKSRHKNFPVSQSRSGRLRSL